MRRFYLPFLLLVLASLACSLPFLSQPDPTATIAPTIAVQPTSPVTIRPTETEAVQPVAAETPTVVAQLSPEHASLSMAGPWVILPALDGLWAANLDGSGLVKLINQASASWYVRQAAASPQGGYLAFTASSMPDSLSGLTLFIAKLPEMTVEVITELTSADTEPSPDATVCDANFEASRAATIGNALAWSPDGRTLAFVGAQAGPTSDVYTYSLDTQEVTQVTGGPSQAFDLSWSPDGAFIVHFGATCFGTGAGFDMSGAWAVTPDGVDTTTLFTSDEDSSFEEALGWLDERSVVVQTSSLTCPKKDLRTINAATGETAYLFGACYTDAAMSPDGSIALVMNADVAADGQGALYLFLPGSDEPILNTDLGGYSVQYSPELGQFFVVDPNVQAVTIDSEAQVEMVTYLLEPPLFSPSGDWWASGMFDAVEVGGKGEMGVVIYEGTVNNLLWSQDDTNGRETLFFYGGDSNDAMQIFTASGPDFIPEPINELRVMDGGPPAMMLYP